MFPLDCKKTNNLSEIASYDMALDDCSIDLLASLKHPTLDKVLERKTKLHFYTRSGLTDMYRNAKKLCFPEIPHDQRNRAGQKLREIFDSFPQLHNYFSFFDICGGPGAWSMFLLSFPNKRGHGITITTPELCRQWYDEVLEDYEDRYTVVDYETNDICMKIIRDHIQCLHEVSHEVFHLVVADGAPPEESYPDENLQELYAFQFICSEVTIALTILEDKGNFVLKILDSYTDATKSLLYILAYCFKQTSIYKPPSSRLVNSEKYVICIGYKRKIGEKIALPPLNRALEILEHGKIVHSLLPSSIYTLDAKFNKTYEQFVKDLGDKQIGALDKVMQIMDEWIANKDKGKGKDQGKNDAKGGKDKGKFGKHGKDADKGKGKGKGKWEGKGWDGKGWWDDEWGKGMRQQWGKGAWGKDWGKKGAPY